MSSDAAMMDIVPAFPDADPDAAAPGADPAQAPAALVKMMNPWLAFCKETRPEVQHLGPQQQLREMGVMWKALSDEEKAPFRRVLKA